MPRRLPAVMLFLLAAVTASARVVSYAPYTDRVAFPALGNLTNRHFALVETIPGSAPSFSTQMRGQIVLYDSKGEEEPRVVYPNDGSQLLLDGLALREPPEESPLIFAAVSGSLPAWVMSVDSGQTWKSV